MKNLYQIKKGWLKQTNKQRNTHKYWREGIYPKNNDDLKERKKERKKKSRKWK